MLRSCILVLLTIITTCQNVPGDKKGAIIRHHGIDVLIQPETHHISGTDQIVLSDKNRERVAGFVLNASLAGVAIVKPPDAILTQKTLNDYKARFGSEYNQLGGVQVNYYEITWQRPDTLIDITIRFSGTIYDTLTSSREYARGFQQTNGLIESRGVYLSGASKWIPSQDDNLFTYTLKTRLPKAWASISQGALISRSSDTHSIQEWKCMHPMEEIYLVANQFHITEEDHNGIQIATYLLESEPKLAGQYLGATKRYLDMYRNMIGEYPFEKFALVENFWQTGYGMPSFTLLGSQVIRLPFIIYTSYGHEILHNWWGNGVYVDWQKGNWCEGLTNYMADHLYKKQRGQDVNYRRSMLQSFLNYVQDSKDFPLTQFTERHNPASQAVGYSKSAMIYHMLNRMLGEKAFGDAIRDFYRQYKFKKASWADVEHVFTEHATSHDLSWFFRQWVTQPGAPELSLENVTCDKKGNDYVCKFTLKQTEQAYRLFVPVQFSGLKDTLVTVEFGKQQVEYSCRLPFKPQKISIDPQYDVFRMLDRMEIPPSLSQTLGAQEAVIVLPTQETAVKKEAYRKLAENWNISENVTFVNDSEIDPQHLPNKSIWILGKENKLATLVHNGVGHELDWQSGSWYANGQKYSEKDYAQAITIRHPENLNDSITYLNFSASKAISSIIHKIPHYGKYGYLIFDGDKNVVKGEWETVESPLIKTIE